MVKRGLYEKGELSRSSCSAFFLLACAASQRAEKKAGTEPLLKSLPHAVAVLPFGNETEEIGISGQAINSSTSLWRGWKGSKIFDLRFTSYNFLKWR